MRTRLFIAAALFSSPLVSISLPAYAYGEQYCREYSRDVTIGGRLQQSYGQACLQPDGSWQMQTATEQQVEPLFITPVGGRADFGHYNQYIYQQTYSAPPVYVAPAPYYAQAPRNYVPPTTVYQTSPNLSLGFNFNGGRSDNWRGGGYRNEPRCDRRNGYYEPRRGRGWGRGYHEWD